MPQRKRTRALNPNAKPKLTDRDEDDHDSLSKQERKDKLEVFLHDFDIKGKLCTRYLHHIYKLGNLYMHTCAIYTHQYVHVIFIYMYTLLQQPIL